jgi:hypothetical protein
MSLTQSGLIFLAAGAVLTWAGIRLSRAGDEIAERAGLSRLSVHAGALVAERSVRR